MRNFELIPPPINTSCNLKTVALAIALTFISSSSPVFALPNFSNLSGEKQVEISESIFEVKPTSSTSLYPVYFSKSGTSLEFIFTDEPGEVQINETGMFKESAISVTDTAELNLKVTNGSLKIEITDGESYPSNGVIHAYKGGNLSIDEDLTLHYEDLNTSPLGSNSDPGQRLIFAGIVGEGLDIAVKGNTDISLNHVKWKDTNSYSDYWGVFYAGMVAGNANADLGAYWTFGSPDTTTSFNIHDINAGINVGEAFAYGVLVRKHKDRDSIKNDINIYSNANISDIHAFSAQDGALVYAAGAEAHDGGLIKFHNSLTIRNISAHAQTDFTETILSNTPSGAFGERAQAYALVASNGGSILVNPDHKKEAVIEIENDIAVGNEGNIEIAFNNSLSHFIGTVYQYEGGSGETNLTFSDSAYWRTTKSNTNKVALTLDNSAVFLNQTVTGDTNSLTEENAITLSLTDLKGENGVFYLRTSLEEVYGDSVSIENATGQHKLMLSSSGTNPTKAATDRALVTQNEGDATFSLANANGVIDLGNYVYSLNSRTGSDGSTQWYLATDSANPDVEQLSPSANAVLALAGSGSQTTQFLYSLSDLRKRMGDIRHGVSEGLYASLRGGKDRISGFASTSFKNEYAALSLGYDKKVNNNWILGLSFEAIEGDQTVKGGGYKAEGEDSTQSIKAYATWFNGIGCYADFVIGINRFDQDISTHMLDGQKVKGDYSSYGFGASTEVGKRFTLGADETWFIEPQAQLSYFQVHGKDFRLNNGMSVEQENADSLTGRLGVVVGRTLLDDSGHGVQFSARAGFNHEFLGDANIYVNKERFTDDSLGSRGYYGLGVDWYASDSVKVYGYIECEEGSHYTSEFNARVGVKYHF